MSTLYIIMAYGGLALAVLCLVAAVILFIRWNIPKAIGEMTGNTQKRAIAKIQEERQKDMQLHDQAGQMKLNSGKIHARTSEEPLTDVLQGEEKTAFLHAAAADEDVTDVLTSNAAGSPDRTKAQSGEEATSILHASSMNEQTTMLHKTNQSKEEETTVLGSGYNREIIMIPDEETQKPGVVIQILELIVTHTEDVVR